ncbi:MAG: pyruvate dehydrogenase (acetyl-transferring) E1 component subunit alpha, partial [Chloroflexi bacterium]
QAPVADLSVRAEGYGFPGVIVDGNDVLAVLEATQSAAARARAGQGPTFIEGKTYRYRGHYEGDPMVYRSPEELAEWRQRDPVATFRARLLAEGLAAESELAAIEQSVQAQLDEAVQFAAAGPQPRPESALDGVYHNTHHGRVF